jgi:large subunit ribosomal protein L15
MKLHDLRPAEGSRKPRTRVGRGIAAGKGKTAGRGTKGQKARAGGSIPAWFEGGQTPLHMRIPKLRGFKRRGRVEYEVVNVGDIGRLADAGAFAADETGRKPAPPTVNQDTLREVGLVRTLARPLKILGQGELSAALFVVADAFSKSAVAKIEAAGGSVTVLERPSGPLRALGVTPADTADGEASAPPDEAPGERGPTPRKSTRRPPEATAEVTADAASEAPAEPETAESPAAPVAGEAPEASEPAATADASAAAETPVAASTPEAGHSEDAPAAASTESDATTESAERGEA